MVEHFCCDDAQMNWIGKVVQIESVLGASSESSVDLFLLRRYSRRHFQYTVYLLLRRNNRRQHLNCLPISDRERSICSEHEETSQKPSWLQAHCTLTGSSQISLSKNFLSLTTCWRIKFGTPLYPALQPRAPLITSWYSYSQSPPLPNLSTKKSCASVTFVDSSGSFQLFTFHHHFLTLTPNVCP